MILGNISAVKGEEFEALKPLLRSTVRVRVALHWQAHCDAALIDSATRQFQDLIKKGKDLAKKECNLANRSVQFDTAMDTEPEDAAATPATKADIDRISTILANQCKTIETQDKLIKRLSGSKGTSTPKVNAVLGRSPIQQRAYTGTSNRSRSIRTGKKKVSSQRSSSRNVSAQRYTRPSGDAHVRTRKRPGSSSRTTKNKPKSRSNRA
jgi:hypothetical protein